MSIPFAGAHEHLWMWTSVGVTTTVTVPRWAHCFFCGKVLWEVEERDHE